MTRVCLAAITDASISGKRIARELTMLIGARGKPQMIVSDNGPEFTSNTMLGWARIMVWIGITSHRADRRRTATSSSMAGCATSFSMRACSSISIRPVGSIRAWVTDYNTARPHSSLGYKTPAAYAGTLTAPKGVTLVEALNAAG